MKKVLVVLLLFLLPLNVFSKEDTFDTARSSIVMDLDSGRVLYQNNADEERLIASITKIMTCIIAIEERDLNSEVEAGEEILKMYGTSIYLELNEKMKLIDLLYGLMLRSGNDASVVIAKAVAGSEDEFVKLMNKKAKELGMTNTTFSNPHGLDEETKNYSTARDMAKLTSYAYKNKTYRKITGTEEYRVKTDNKSYLWYNRMKLLGDYKYCTGGKNGYTPSAGKTLVTTHKKGDLKITVVTLDDNDEYNNHERLAEYIFDNYSNYNIVDKKDFDLVLDDNKYYVKKSFTYPLTEDEKDNVKVLASIDDSLNSGKVGNIKISLNNKTLKKIPIYIEEKKKKENFFTKLFS